MIESVAGNLLDADVDALVNTVNCVGLMGKGIALQFKQAFPEMFRDYARAARAGGVVPGRMHVYPTGALVGPRYIVNFPTKRHWREPSRMEDIDAGLLDLVEQVRRLGIRSIAIPPLGSGNGGLDWSAVRPRIVRAFEALPDVRVLLYEPGGEPAAEARRAGPERPKLTPARALFIRLMDQYKALDYRLTLLEIQKLAYFLQVAGEPLKLPFKAHLYGPYAHALIQVLQRLDGHYLHGATNVKPTTEIRLAEGAAEEASAFLASNAEAQTRLARLAELIEGYETPYGMELLSSVHWVATHDEAARANVDACIARTHAWNDRKRKLLREDHIRLAWERLRDLGWLDARGGGALV